MILASMVTSCPLKSARRVQKIILVNLDMPHDPSLLYLVDLGSLLCNEVMIQHICTNNKVIKFLHSFFILPGW